MLSYARGGKAVLAAPVPFDVSAISLPILQALIHALLPSVSTVAFFTSASSTFAASCQPRTAFLGSSVLSFAGIGCLGAIVQFLFMFTEGKTENPNEVLWVLAGVSVCVVVLLAARLLRGGAEVAILSRFILPLIVLGEFLIFAVDSDQQPVEVFVIGIAWMYFRVFYWMIWRAAALRSSRPPAVVFAVGQMALTLGCAVGSVIYIGVMELNPAEFIILGGVCMAVVLVSVGFFDSTRFSSQYAGEEFDSSDKAACERCVDAATARYGLSRQERVIARMLVEGKDNDAIRKKLVIAPNTLRTHLRNIYRKTDIHRREDLVVLLRSMKRM